MHVLEGFTLIIPAGIVAGVPFGKNRHVAGFAVQIHFDLAQRFLVRAIRLDRHRRPELNHNTQFPERSSLTSLHRIVAAGAIEGSGQPAVAS